MIRIILTYLVPLALPTAVYLLWFWLTRQRAASGQAAVAAEAEEGEWWRTVPWAWLALAGIALVGATLFVFALSGGGTPGETYVPPHVEDGRVVPGRSVD